jgi:uncharacterized protein YbgA (DUF1722 family)
MNAMTAIATPRRHQRPAAHGRLLQKTLDAASRAELLAAIEDYRLGLVPLIVPLTLVRHHIHGGVEYLAGQVYRAHPKELMLRSRVNRTRMARRLACTP